MSSMNTQHNGQTCKKFAKRQDKTKRNGQQQDMQRREETKSLTETVCVATHFALQPSGGNQVDGLPPAPSFVNVQPLKSTTHVLEGGQFRATTLKNIKSQRNKLN